MPRSRWPLHDDVVSILQVSDEMIGDQLRHEVIAVPEPAAPIALERKAQGETKLVRIGG